jgi:hypothetical protein
MTISHYISIMWKKGRRFCYELFTWKDFYLYEKEKTWITYFSNIVEHYLKSII